MHAQGGSPPDSVKIEKGEECAKGGDNHALSFATCSIKCLTPYAKDMFPPARHYRVKKLKPGVHFSECSLHQMTPFKKAQAIVGICDDAMTACRQHDGPYMVVDAFAGIGGNALAFALNPRVHTLVAIERDLMTHNMLRRNMNSLVEPAAAWRVLHATTTLDVLLEHLSAVPDAHSMQPVLPACLFFDPPWGMYMPYIDVMEPPAGHPPILEWLQRLASVPSLACVVVKVPKRYQWDNAKTPKGWEYSINATVAKMNMLLFSKPA